MATYTKKLKSLEIHLMLDGEALPSIADTVTDDVATRMLNGFKNYETMSAVVGRDDASLPYHAIQYIKVTDTDGEVTKADPYGCE